jgi:hypothetical protein
MTAVTITGSAITPSTFLAPGRTVTVARTELVDKLIARGFVIVTDAPALAAPEPEEDTAPDGAVESSDGLTETIPDYDGVPGRNASRAVWAAFLESRGFIVLPTHTRDELLTRWDAADD